MSRGGKREKKQRSKRGGEEGKGEEGKMCGMQVWLCADVPAQCRMCLCVECVCVVCVHVECVDRVGVVLCVFQT